MDGHMANHEIFCSFLNLPSTHLLCISDCKLSLQVMRSMKTDSYPICLLSFSPIKKAMWEFFYTRMKALFGSDAIRMSHYSRSYQCTEGNMYLACVWVAGTWSLDTGHPHMSHCHPRWIPKICESKALAWKVLFWMSSCVGKVFPCWFYWNRIMIQEIRARTYSTVPHRNTFGTGHPSRLPFDLHQQLAHEWSNIYKKDNHNNLHKDASNVDHHTFADNSSFLLSERQFIDRNNEI